MSEEDKAIADKVYDGGMDGVIRSLRDDQIDALHELLTSSAPQVIGVRDALWRLGHAISRTMEQRAFKAAQDGNAEAVSRILTHGRSA